MIGNLLYRHTFIACKNMRKDLVIGLDMKHLHCLGCHWINNRHMFLHQGTNELTQTDDPMNVIPLKTISNVNISSCAIATPQLGDENVVISGMHS